MEQILDGTKRRSILLETIKHTSKPLSGTALGKQTGVSRQVIVQDIALLRMQGYPIVATARGYVWNATSHCIRFFKVYHTNEQIEDELQTIIDLGGQVQDVAVNHRAYGKMSAPLDIKNRRDIKQLVTNLKTGKSSALLNITSGYHFHHVLAESEEILDEIEEHLKEKGYLIEFLPYELDGDTEKS